MADSANKEAPSEHINIKVQGQEGSIIHFKIRKNTPLRKLMLAYCERLGLKQPSVRFIFDGNSVHETDTPASLEMEENDTIEVFQTQTGGL
ncbi:Small ubiquitin-related modifier 2 [Schistosoma japonicum]|uniref:Small ubiquitin-related modifier n=1 Tax=Schistosoma japonicum TaxID=6182 RepID=Q5BS96_SCHJA|nr:SJCHGC05342 protein [Schistosoma japonicum]KAH8870500.1 Small ubiquitin-related modifier 2-B [Schistosoma japonicum]KAH8870501.1 Small ubiquitin-related modifier 2-B [Schistosoma japonicum]TNN06507.1 Small ubiquitin-related modifier 2 [Schistosoma japonicum]TNN06508.1 Small ubiquitin-related modifier 2 [Schistosoma japonicum]